MKKIILAITTIISICFSNSIYSQIIVNKIWAKQFGIVSDQDWSITKGDDQGNIFTIGHTVISNDQINVLLTKQNSFGQTIWEKEFGNSNEKNYGVSLEFDASNNIYVIATSYSNLNQHYDYLVIKYDQSANELWHIYHDGDGGDDFPTDLSYLSSEDKLYITGTSFHQGSESDFLTLKINSSNGNIEWSQYYDFNFLDELPTYIVANQNKVIVTGASANSTTDWDVTTIIYSLQGNAIDTFRTNNPLPGFDQPTAVSRDNNDNLYITGNRAKSVGQYNIHTLKLDADLNIVWEATFDGSGIQNNAYDLKLDNFGNVYVCGTTEKSNGGRDFLLLKYDSNGNEIWQRKRRAANDQNIAIAKKIAFASNGDVVVTGEVNESGTNQAIVIKYTPQGDKIWDVKPTNNNLLISEEQVNGIHIDSDKISIGSSVTLDGVKTYQTTQLEEFDRNVTYDLDGDGEPFQVKNEVIIRFNPDVVNTSFVDDASLHYGTVSQIITDPTVITNMGQALGVGKDIGQWKLLKIFNNLNTSITTTLTRTGETIPMPPLWSAMILKIENDTTAENAASNLEAITTNAIMYAHPNSTFKLGTPPNDPLYSTMQLSLNNSPNPNAHINIEPAWDLIENSPTPWDKTIKIGILDTGLEYGHEDFVCTPCGGLMVDGTSDKSVVYESLDFVNQATGQPLESIDIFEHGTKVAGIIGALRNNQKGIAGIAGGNMDNNIPSAQLYSYRVAATPTSLLGSDMVKAWMYITNPTGMPIVDIVNHSSYTTGFDDLWRNTYEIAVKSDIIFINLRGNEGNTAPIYPTNFREDWSISVGSSGTNGRYLQTNTDPGLEFLTNTIPSDNPNPLMPFSSSYGMEMDIIAPGTTALVTTTRPSTSPSNFDNPCYDVSNSPYDLYNCFNGSSAATPHTVGVTALLLEHYEGVQLAMEDIEHLLEYSAVDIVSLNDPIPFNYKASYDEYNGWGRLNAENALKLIDENHDNYKVIHVKVNGANINVPPNCNDTSSPNSDCDFDLLRSEFTYISPSTGNLLTKLDGNASRYLSFKKTHTAPFQINLCNHGATQMSNTNLVQFADTNKESYWVRNSDAEVDLWGDQIFIGDPADKIVDITPGDLIEMESLNVTMDNGCPIIEGVLKGYSYRILSSTFLAGATPGMEEFPKSSDILDKFAFSLMLENADNVNSEIEVDYIPDVSTSNNKLSQAELALNVYPNPTTNKIHIDYSIDNSSNILIQIVGVSGQIIKELNLSSQEKGRHTEIIDLKKLPNGVYFCKVQNEYKIAIQRIIKN